MLGFAGQYSFQGIHVCTDSVNMEIDDGLLPFGAEEEASVSSSVSGAGPSDSLDMTDSVYALCRNLLDRHGNFYEVFLFSYPLWRGRSQTFLKSLLIAKIYSVSNLYVGVVTSFLDYSVKDGSVYQTPDSSLAAAEGFGDDFEV